MIKSAFAAGALCGLMLSACGTQSGFTTATRTSPAPIVRLPAAAASDVVLHALGLIDVGYVFGGRNPEAGVDCSGLVTLVYEGATGLKLPHNAARIAQLSRPVEKEALRPGDLVFFNTQNAPFSHVGVYIGDQRFIHAPRSNSAVRIDSLNSRYFAQRFEGGRTLFED
ncbi:MAG: hypothetical protein RIR70_429 [Pseudomonadota bacterium]|jgi:cell wall-associated NlpC family hydrolase